MCSSGVGQCLQFAMNSRTVTGVAVKGIRKDSRPEVFILQVLWSDGTKYIIYRSFTDIFNMHVKLLEDFPIEAGKVKSNERVLPDLSRSDARCSQPQIMASIAVYFERLLRLEKKIICYPELTSLLSLTLADLDAAKDTCSRANTNTEKSSRKAETEASKERKVAPEISDISGPLPLETYEVVASYKSKGKSEVNLKAGDLVDVLDKNPNGWWLVRVDDQEGWAPSTYLQPLDDDSYSAEEIPCLSGEIFLTTAAYTAQQDDELSFPTNATIEVLSKVKDGWWIASYNCKVGYVPAAFLMRYNDPYLETGIRTASSGRPEAPVQRRNTIKGIKQTAQRDLTIYRKASEKNRAARTTLATTLDNVLSTKVCGTAASSGTGEDSGTNQVCGTAASSGTGEDSETNQVCGTAASSGTGEDSGTNHTAPVTTLPFGHENRVPAITDVESEISAQLVVMRKTTDKSRSQTVSREAQFFTDADAQPTATGTPHVDEHQQ